MEMQAESFWGSFRLDPRNSEHVHLRASDADRELVRTLLADAYADGRLSRGEYDERDSANIAAKTLGELPPLVADLVRPSGRGLPVLRSRSALRAEAVRGHVHHTWERAVAGSSPFFVCALIWLVGGMGSFWPVWALIPTLIAVAPLILGAPGSIQRRIEKLDREQRGELSAPANEPPAEGPAESAEGTPGPE